MTDPEVINDCIRLFGGIDGAIDSIRAAAWSAKKWDRSFPCDEMDSHPIRDSDLRLPSPSIAASRGKSTYLDPGEVDRQFHKEGTVMTLDAVYSSWCMQVLGEFDCGYIDAINESEESKDKVFQAFSWMYYILVDLKKRD